MEPSNTENFLVAIVPDKRLSFGKFQFKFHFEVKLKQWRGFSFFLLVNFTKKISSNVQTLNFKSSRPGAKASTDFQRLSRLHSKIWRPKMVCIANFAMSSRDGNESESSRKRMEER